MHCQNFTSQQHSLVASTCGAVRGAVDASSHYDSPCGTERLIELAPCSGRARGERAAAHTAAVAQCTGGAAFRLGGS
ncbi:jg497 [Pararge aegeria aegeria]|uniref:Jg497 protein n=1 Tax=Pararge aegeria aegeria TaxID=348720 RepID=A0A8S4QFR4_9NEOP|nr:jg497 [Pararge aegeria aegeria]